ncbi:MAG: TolC family protein [bacterium]|jgi:outer membrane protein
MSVSVPTRTHVLSAAARVYGELGFRGATTRKIAEAAGVNEVTLFRQFGSKNALLLEALRVSGATHPDTALPEIPVDPLAELTAWSAHMRKSLVAMRGMIRKAMAEFEVNPAMPKCMTHGAAQSLMNLRDYLTRLVEQGAVRADADVISAASMLMSAIFHDALGRDMMPHAFPQPVSAAPTNYARLTLQSLGYDFAALQPASDRKRTITRVQRALTVALLLVAAPLAAVAQGATAQGAAATPAASISLADALTMGQKASHTVHSAEAGVMRAGAQQQQARAQYLPQINGTFAYQRLMQSQFSAITAGSSSGSGSGSGSSGGTSSFGDITKIFASPNTATLGVSLTQNVYTAGKLESATKGAAAARTAADIGLDAARAQVNLDVAQAYFDAVAAKALVDIADSTLAQAERTLAQTTVSKQVGSAAEFDLLRARVARDNQRPALIQARGNYDLTMMRLRQLLGISLDKPLALTTPIRDEGVAAEAPPADTAVAHRSTVRQAAANVTAQQFALSAADMNRLPSVQVSSAYQRFAYPVGILPLALNQYYPNWTISLGLSVPVFTGGKLTADRAIAQANLIDAQQSFEQSRELAALDARTAILQLEQAQASYASSVGTDEQARRAYTIAEVRFNEGISTQVELLQSRTQYEQARLNRVLAARDLEVARLRVAFLKDLPVTVRR